LTRGSRETEDHPQAPGKEATTAERETGETRCP